MSRDLRLSVISILRPDTGRFGCAIRTDMWWRSPVRTVKAILKTKPGSIVGARPSHEAPFVIANERGSRAALARDDEGGDGDGDGDMAANTD
jgi:hypothetical protein